MTCKLCEGNTIIVAQADGTSITHSRSGVSSQLEHLPSKTRHISPKWPKHALTFFTSLFFAFCIFFLEVIEFWQKMRVGPSRKQNLFKKPFLKAKRVLNTASLMKQRHGPVKSCKSAWWLKTKLQGSQTESHAVEKFCSWIIWDHKSRSETKLT